MTQFIVVPLSGIQICRRLPLTLPKESAEAVWKAATQLGNSRSASSHAALPIIASYIACDQKVENSGWISCSAQDGVFYRLLRIGANLAIDMVIDTQNSAGKIPQNKIDCAIESGVTFFKRKHPLASFFVEANSQPRNVIGSLIMDFGNTGTSAIFSPDNTSPFAVRPIGFHNPFDIHEGDESLRPAKDKNVLKSTTLLLNVPDSDTADPWIILGKRAEELIASLNPLITSLYAPKKYVRFWPEHLKAQEPTVPFRGVQGDRPGLKPALQLVEQVIQQMLELTISTLTNPQFSSTHPDFYPQIREILLTYPLTWREVDKSLFLDMVKKVARKQVVLDNKVRDRFKVELVCSEPVAVATFAFWELLYHFFHAGTPEKNLGYGSLASSLFGNLEGDPRLRLLILDIGGGSSDIALVEANWSVHNNANEDQCVSVNLNVLESLRFNRAGDRLSHIIATAIWEYMCVKHNITETLNFRAPSANPAFSLQNKRAAVSEIMNIVEKMKIHLSLHDTPWEMDEEQESKLLSELHLAINGQASSQDHNAIIPEQMTVSREVLRKWVEMDRQSIKTRGEPGFMDIFFFLGELATSLKSLNKTPHLVLLSGRTSRLDFIRDLTVKHLKLPYHRVLTLNDMIPHELHGVDQENMDKLAVVFGAHRFRYGGQIQFRLVSAPQDKFQRFIGTLRETPNGLKLNRVLVKPGDSIPLTLKLKIEAGQSFQIGNSFRNDGLAEILATVTNESGQQKEIEIDLTGDYQVVLKRTKASDGVHLDEWVPGGSNEIVDNFNDTGRIDEEPTGFLKGIVLTNRDEWMKGSHD